MPESAFYSAGETIYQNALPRNIGLYNENRWSPDKIFYTSKDNIYYWWW
jgi:hypothetical protein